MALSFELGRSSDGESEIGREDAAMLLSTPKNRNRAVSVNCVSRYIGSNADSTPAIHQGKLPEIGAPEPKRFIVQPIGCEEGLDLTHSIIEVIARELWKSRAGNDLLNWLEAEHLFQETMQGTSQHNGGETPLPSTHAIRKRTPNQQRARRSRLRSSRLVHDEIPVLTI
jgi:hypothetical protein